MPVIPRDLCLAGGEVTDPLVRPGGQWVSGVHSTGQGLSARAVLRMWSTDGSRVVELLADPVPSTGRGLSGGVHAWNHSGDAVYACTKEAGIVEIRLHGDDVAFVCATSYGPTRTWSTPSVGSDGRTLYAVAEWNELWSAPTPDVAPTLLSRADDGYIVDSDGPGGRALRWDRPHMAWTCSHLTDRVRRDEVAVQQPRSTRDGASRGYIDDSSGVMNVVLEADERGALQCTIEDGCEHAGPVWGPGQRTWCFSPDGRRVAYTRNEEGFGSLWVYERATGQRTMLGRGVHGCLSWEGNTLGACRTGARTPPEIVVYDMNPGNDPGPARLVRPADDRWYDADLRGEMVEPTMHTAASFDGVSVPYRLFRARTAHGGLLVWIHGGPIDQWQVTFRPRHLYWLSRGWSIAIVDHRGTTGWGREFAGALDGLWGDADARDVVAAVGHLQGEHGFEPSRTVLKGSSAGGLSALNAARRAPEMFAGAVLAYPVVDLVELVGGDDPFESHYMPRLLGTADSGSSRLKERSPHRDPVALASVPLLVFHGDADLSVPLVHSERLRDAVAGVGGDCKLVVFPGEGHGFRLSDHLDAEFTLTEQFLARIAG